jgi:hypothetical protein
LGRLESGGKIAAMRRLFSVVAVIGGLSVLGILIYQLPPIHDRLSWRVDFALTYLRGVVNPVEAPPTPMPMPSVVVTFPPTRTIAPIPTLLPTLEISATPPPPPTPIPQSIALPAPQWEKQDINNCGPASLTMYLRFYGWEGAQQDIADVIKPVREDRNVNVEELVYYVRTRAGWLNAEFRVGGDLELIKQLLAAGVPVMVEESFYFDQTYWPGDDLWGAHYLLVTGYDEAQRSFIGQDSFRGASQAVPYETLDEYWQAFNRVYILIYLPYQEGTVKAILGSNWDTDVNRQRALEVANVEATAEPGNPYAWFNLGSNLVYFERYIDASEAYDQARKLGLPQRMYRYQFSPFIAYFHIGHFDELLSLTDYALKITPSSEEALLWRGWALYRLGRNSEAIESFNQALFRNPNYQDAQYAIDFVSANP